MDNTKAKSDNLRDTVFNTINLINQIDSGEESTPEQRTHEGGKDVSLSDTFVNGIREKMINPSENNANEAEGATETQKAFKQTERIDDGFRSRVQSAIEKMGNLIESQNAEIASLKKSLSELQAKMDGSNAPVQEPVSQLSHNSAESGGMSHQDTTTNVNNGSDDGMLGMIHHDVGGEEEQSSLDFNTFSMDENVADNNENKDSGQESGHTLSDSEKNFQPSSSDSGESYNPVSQASVQEKPQDSVEKAEEKPDEGNPRVGNYESGDVLIEKYFYYGKN